MNRNRNRNRVLFQTGKLGAALAVVVLAASTALAQAPGDQGSPPGGPGPEMGMGPHHPPMERAMGPFERGGEHRRWWNDPHAIEKFKLTDAQRKSMDQIFQEHRLTLVDLHATLDKAELAMEPMIQEDQPDEGKILSQIDRIAQARSELEKANARMLFDLRKQLTPEQWKLVHAEFAARREGRSSEGAAARWHGRGGPGAPGGPGAGSGSGPAAGAAGQGTPPQPPGGAGEDQ
jgi:protein CpxP